MNPEVALWVKEWRRLLYAGHKPHAIFVSAELFKMIKQENDKQNEDLGLAYQMGPLCFHGIPLEVK